MSIQEKGIIMNASFFKTPKVVTPQNAIHLLAVLAEIIASINQITQIPLINEILLPIQCCLGFIESNLEEEIEIKPK
jgi:hypothetical protein